MAYSDAFKAECLIKLAFNKYDYQKTANETGLPEITLRRWDKNINVTKNIPELLERAISRLLMFIPEKMRGQDWAIALGILLDKWLLLQGEPTARIETVMKLLDELPQDELNELIRQFEQAASRVDVAKIGASAPQAQPDL